MTALFYMFYFSIPHAKTTLFNLFYINLNSAGQIWSALILADKVL